MELRPQDLLIKLPGPGPEQWVAWSRDSSPPQLVVLTRHRPSHTDLTQVRHRASLARRLDHTALLPVLRVRPYGDGLATVTTMVYGDRLPVLLERTEGAIDVRACIKLVAQVAGGLAHAHALTREDGTSAPLRHRHLIAEDIVVDIQGRVVLTGFMESRGQDDMSHMAPEQCTGAPEDVRTEVYRLGQILWELLTRRALYAEQDEFDLMEAICTQTPPPPSRYHKKCSPLLDAVVRKALARDPAKRFANVQQLHRALDRLLTRMGAAMGPAEARALFVEHLPHRTTLWHTLHDAARREDFSAMMHLTANLFGVPAPSKTLLQTDAGFSDGASMPSKPELSQPRKKNALFPTPSEIDDVLDSMSEPEDELFDALFEDAPPVFRTDTQEHRLRDALRNHQANLAQQKEKPPSGPPQARTSQQTPKKQEPGPARPKFNMKAMAQEHIDQITLAPPQALQPYPMRVSDSVVPVSDGDLTRPAPEEQLLAARASQLPPVTGLPPDDLKPTPVKPMPAAAGVTPDAAPEPIAPAPWPEAPSPKEEQTQAHTHENQQTTAAPEDPPEAATSPTPQASAPRIEAPAEPAPITAEPPNPAPLPLHVSQDAIAPVPQTAPPGDVVMHFWDDEDEEEHFVEPFSLAELLAAAPEQVREGEGLAMSVVMTTPEGMAQRTELIRGPITWVSEDKSVQVDLGAQRATLHLTQGARGEVRFLNGGSPGLLQEGTATLELGERAKIKSAGAHYRLQLYRPKAPHRSPFEPAFLGALAVSTTSLYLLAGLVALAFHAALLLSFWYVGSIEGVNLVVDTTPEPERFAEGLMKLPEPPEASKDRPLPPRSRPKPKTAKAQQAPRQDPAEQVVKVPDSVRKKLNQRRQARAGGKASGPPGKATAGSILTALNKGNADSPNIGAALDGIKGKPSGSGGALSKLDDTLADLAGQGPGQDKGGNATAELGKLAGGANGSKAGKLQGRAGGGKVRGKVRSVAALAKVQGSLSRGEVTKVINRYQGRILGCYERALLKNPTLSGKITYQWSIGTNGRVAGARQASSSLGDAKVSQCILKIIRGMKFPKPEGGPVQIRFPFIFKATQ